MNTKTFQVYPPAELTADYGAIEIKLALRYRYIGHEGYPYAYGVLLVTVETAYLETLIRDVVGKMFPVAWCKLICIDWSRCRLCVGGESKPTKTKGRIRIELVYEPHEPTRVILTETE